MAEVVSTNEESESPKEAEATSPPGTSPPGTSQAEERPAAPAGPPSQQPRFGPWLAKDSRKRRLLLAAGLYCLVVLVFALVAGDRMLTHTPFNHFAHLADAWLHGRHDLRAGAPGYAMGNDFAEFQGKTFISFPPFPAALMLPLVWLAGSPENFRDGQFVVWLAGIGPSVLFLVLEKLRRGGRSQRSEKQNLMLAALFAFGTVYFFTSVQGTVWFAGHVVGAGVCALYILFATDAERPLLAGAMMGLVWMTRPTMALTSVFFLMEAVHASRRSEGSLVTPGGGAPAGGALQALAAELDKAALARRLALFALPVLGSLALASWFNHSRFGTPSPAAFGHEHLAWVRGARLSRWGLFDFHYLGKNLGCVLSNLPYLPPKGGFEGGTPFKVNLHGLPLWFTSPFYLLALWPRSRSFTYWACAASVMGPLAMNLLYQNTGWSQFGYRFSNDYALFVMLMLAVSQRPLKGVFAALGAWAIAWNLFGAVTFERGQYSRFYEHDRGIIYQPD